MAMAARGRRLAACVAGAVWIGVLAGVWPIGAVVGADSAAGHVRPFGPHAPWNVPVAGLPRSPQSSLYARLLWTEAPADHAGNFNLGFDQYTYPVYHADQATGLYPVTTERRTNINGTRIPWNPSWRPAPGTDAQVIIVDPASGREWDLWQVSFDGSTIHATNGSLVAGDYRTKEDGNVPSRGIGIQYLAMLVRPQEIAQGKIEHALSMPIKNTSRTVYVPPATKLEGKGRTQDAIPEGTRFALNVTDQDIDAWLATLPAELSPGMRQAARIIAVALRDYGWFITDNAGGATLQFESRVTAGDAWKQLGLATQPVDYKEYPRDLLDGLITPDNIYAIAPSDQYPAALRARAS